jgi:hypothetical protein
MFAIDFSDRSEGAESSGMIHVIRMKVNRFKWSGISSGRAEDILILFT